MDTPLLANLVAYSAQVTVVVAIGAALAALVRVDAAGVRYVYWRALLALCLVMPWLQVRRSVVVPAPDSVSVGIAQTSSLSPASPGAIAPAAATDWVALIGWVLLAGVVVRACRVCFGLWQLGRLRQTGTLAAPCAIHEEAQALVRATAEIRYVASGQPVTFGFWRPVVLLPEMLREQSEAIQQVVLCHELFHVRRRDWVWVVAEEMVKTAFWFHPAVLWLIGRVRQAREEVVDELTVLATSQRRAYIEALLVFADTPGRAPAAAFARRRHLFRRMVLISKETVMSSKRVLASMATMTAVVAASGWSAIAVFPLTQTVIAQDRDAGIAQERPGGRAGAPAVFVPANQAGPVGPLERQARPITPENPIPRRTFSVAPQNPAVDAGSVAIVSARLVVDRQGRVAEARSIGGGVRGGRGGSPEPAAPPIDAFVNAVIDAARQWQYDPPADGPIAFDVTFAFMPGGEPRMLAHGLPASPAAAAPVSGVVAGIPMAPPPPPPPPGWAAGAVRVGGNIKAPEKTRHVAPIYPPIAQSAAVQGVVILEAVIGGDGKVQDARVLRSVPLLDQAAIDAVRQWEFTPTMLNATPVPVIMTVTVQFTLS
jgi:TonB family protein